MSIEPRQFLIYFAVKYKGDWQRILQAITTKEQIEPEEIIRVCSALKCKTVTMLDEIYPLSLKNVNKPPFVLFCLGDIGLLRGFNNKIAIVGSREPTDYAAKNTARIAKEIAPDHIVISGCARGIDSIAQETVIKNGGRTIGVLGSGIDVFYPKQSARLIEEIAKNHLLISEYPEGTTPVKDNFKVRNRIVVGLSNGVVVFDVKKESGTLSTVNLAIQNNRNVMSIPYPLGADFLNNGFIKEGCMMIEDGDDIRFLTSNF